MHGHLKSPEGRLSRPSSFSLTSCFPAPIESRFSTVICAPVYSAGQGLSTQAAVGIDEGLKHASSIMCDNLASLRKNDLTQYVGSLRAHKMAELDLALKHSLDLP